MRFDPEKEKKKKRKKENRSLGGFPLSLLNLLETPRGGRKKKALPVKGLFIRIVYRNYSIFHLLLLFITPTHVLGLTLPEQTARAAVAAASRVRVRQIRIRRQLLSYALGL